MRRGLTVGAVVAAAVLGSGCSVVTGEKSPGQLLNDVTMTLAVKRELAAREGVGSLTGVHVRTHNDMVYLTGEVPDQATRARIEELVRDIAGSNRVTNALEVERETSAASAR